MPQSANPESRVDHQTGYFEAQPVLRAITKEKLFPPWMDVRSPDTILPEAASSHFQFAVPLEFDKGVMPSQSTARWLRRKEKNMGLGADAEPVYLMMLVSKESKHVSSVDDVTILVEPVDRNDLKINPPMLREYDQEEREEKGVKLSHFGFAYMAITGEPLPGQDFTRIVSLGEIQQAARRPQFLTHNSNKAVSWPTSEMWTTNWNRDRVRLQMVLLNGYAERPTSINDVSIVDTCIDKVDLLTDPDLLLLYEKVERVITGLPYTHYGVAYMALTGQILPGLGFSRVLSFRDIEEAVHHTSFFDRTYKERVDTERTKRFHMTALYEKYMARFEGRRLPIMDESGIPPWIGISKSMKIPGLEDPKVPVIVLKEGVGGGSLTTMELRTYQRPYKDPYKEVDNGVIVMVFCQQIDMHELNGLNFVVADVEYQRKIDAAKKGIVAVCNRIYPEWLSMSLDDLKEKMEGLLKSDAPVTAAMELTWAIRTGKFPHWPYSTSINNQSCFLDHPITYFPADILPVPPEDAVDPAWLADWKQTP